MIFVTVGSQKFQFNRLLEKIDELVANNKINEEVFAQIGYSDYKPQHFQYKDFLDREEFKDLMGKCEIVITHGGTGAIITAVKQGKKVIAIPRLAKYGEHVDDHQIQLLEEFEKSGLIKGIHEIEELGEALNKIDKIEFVEYKSNTKKIIEDIKQFIES